MNDLPKVTQLLAGRAQGRIRVYVAPNLYFSHYVAGPLDTGGVGPSSWDPPQAFLSLSGMSLL